jgi:glycosyltransferase involved in cell wall biosynthesis
VESGRPGDAAARNAALPHARGALLLFTDADCWVANDWLDRAARMAEEGVRAAAGRVRHPPTPRGWATAATCFPHFQALRPGWTRNLCTANAMLHRDLLADGFPDVQNCGDRLLAWRLARKGERIRYAGDWHVEHRPLLEDRAFLHRAEAYARATVEARRRDPSLPGGGLLRFGAVAATAGWTAYRSLRDLETLLRHHAAMDLPLRQINAAVRQCLRFRRAYANALARLLRENAAKPPDGAEETA